MFNAINQYYTTFIVRMDQFSQKKLWVIYLSVFVFFYVLFVAFPSFDLLNKDFAATWAILFQYADHPLTPNAYAPTSHEAKMTFRLLIPVLVHIAHLNMWGVLLIQFLAGLLSWIVFAKIAEKYTGDKVTAIVLTIAMACINFSKSTLDIRGIFFDNIAFLFLLIPFLYTRSIVIFTCITLAAWIDERAFITSSFILLFLLFNWKQKNSAVKIASVILAWAAYFGLRYYLSRVYHLSTPSEGMGVSEFLDQMNNWLLGIISGLEGFWLLPFLFFLYTIRSGKWMQAMLLAGNMLIIILVALSVTDISRSMNYLFISIPLILQYLSKKEPVPDLRKIAVIVLLLSFLFPAYSFSNVRETYWSYPLPLQLFRMFFLSP